jgi:DNA-binding transcriptional regulator YiaG
MNWKQILHNSKDIAIALGISSYAVDKWKSNNKVPRTRFESLVPVLEKLGHKLTTIEMGKLNEHKNT